MFNNNQLTSDHLIIVLVGLIIVFISLTILYLVFDNLPKLLAINLKRTLSSSKNSGTALDTITVKSNNITVDETAAISAALFLFIEELHDEENTVLTIQKLNKKYSPWNSKIYNVINGLNKRF